MCLNKYSAGWMWTKLLKWFNTYQDHRQCKLGLTTLLLPPWFSNHGPFGRMKNKACRLGFKPAMQRATLYSSWTGHRFSKAAPLLRSAAIFALLFLSFTISAKLFSILTGPAQSSPVQSVLSCPLMSVLLCLAQSYLSCLVHSCLSYCVQSSPVCPVLSCPVQFNPIKSQSHFSKLFHMKNTIQPAQPYLDSFYCLVFH